MPKPLGRVSLESFEELTPWQLFNEDGFVLACFPDGDAAKSALPDKALPGIDMIPALAHLFEHLALVRREFLPGSDMTHAIAHGPASLTQTPSGKLYIQIVDSAYWNLEVTGLEKVKALPGGKLSVPAAK